MNANWPQIIQGGMGVNISGWRLARAVAVEGELGVVSGTAMEVVVARQLQMGDPGGAIRRAFAAFPFPEIANAMLERYFVPGGKAPAVPFRSVPMHQFQSQRTLTGMTVLSAFSAIWLAKEGHSGRVGFNLLCKIPLPTLAALYGAMLAGVDVVLMGAGIPRSIPGALDALADGRSTTLRVDVEGALPGEEFDVCFDPAELFGGRPPRLQRPAFFAIVSSSVLAMTLAKKANGRVDGFVVEYPSAGGHNAPPRGVAKFDECGAPIYGPKDFPDLAQIASLSIPFWLAGGFGAAGKLHAAVALGANGVQVGTLFAFCEESGMDPAIKDATLQAAKRADVDVITDALASPTGFPFKLVRLRSDDPSLLGRERICDLGYLQRFYRKPDGTVGSRCPGENQTNFLRKGGDLAMCERRQCICNGLMATAGLAQIRSSGLVEPPVVTSGDFLAEILNVSVEGGAYSARAVIDFLRATSAN